MKRTKKSLRKAGQMYPTPPTQRIEQIADSSGNQGVSPKAAQIRALSGDSARFPPT